MKTPTTFKKVLGGSMAATALAGGALLAQAPAASATSDWDRLAECESGGDWSIDTGNGFHGGLQFQQSSWEAVGGTGNPANASKAEQIDRAEQLRQIQGWGAWPACSAQLGLSGAPGGTPSGGENTGASQQQSQPQEEQTQQAPEQQQSQQAPEQQSQPQEEQTQQAPQQQAPEQQQQSQPAPQPQQQTQQQAPEQQAPEQSAPAGGAELSGETYTVQSGDTLGSIASQFGVDWQQLFNANTDTIDDPNLIFVGDQLQLPVVN